MSVHTPIRSILPTLNAAQWNKSTPNELNVMFPSFAVHLIHEDSASQPHTHTHIRQENDVESIIVIRLVSLYYQKYFYCFCDVNSVGLPHSPFSALWESLWSIEIPSSFLYFFMSFSLGISDICGKPSLFLENRFERYDLLSSGMDDRYETTWKYAKLIG